MGKKYYYKAMDKDMKCRDFQFEVGETYTIESEELELCSDKVFHFCERLEDTIEYYDRPTDMHFLIEVLGDIVTKKDKSGSNKIRIVREITRNEIEEHIQKTTTYNGKRFLAYYSCNVKELERLSKSKDWRVRVIVAKNLNTPAHILEKLSKDKHLKVREAVVKNLNTSIHILEELAKDEDYFVCEYVALNPNTPLYILVELSKAEDWEVRLAVAKNPNTPVYLLKKLAKDEDLFVSVNAEERLREITQ